MRIDRFFIQTPIEGEKVEIHDDALMHQWRNVFRYQVGTRVMLLDNTGFVHTAVIEALSNRGATCLVIEKKELPAPDRDVWLFMSLIKKDKFELVVQKATELGVSHVVPLETEFTTERRLNASRLQKVITEASEQCGRGVLPTLHKTMSLSDSLVYTKEHNIDSFVALPDGERSVDASVSSIALFVGPEGGFSEEEQALFVKNKIPQISLGTFILRAETAAIVGVSQLV